MIVPFIRSSLLNSALYCENKCFIEYNLGIKEPPNIKTVHGTIVHKVLECLALCKFAHQKGENFIDDPVIGKFSFTEKDLYKKSKLPSKVIDGINKHRSNKRDYKWDCQLKQDYRIGQDIVNLFIEKSYEYYKNPEWTARDWWLCNNYVWIVLEYQNGICDPRNLEIYAPEMEFNIPTNWTYNYKVDNQKYTGKVHLKGTVDLITKDCDILSIMDFKTGQRKDWNTGQVKTLDYLHNDKQLKFYFFCLHKLLDIDHIIMNIFFIRDGGLFTVNFEKSDLKKIEKDIKNDLDKIINITIPTLKSDDQTDYLCSICHFYKNKFPGDDRNICKRIQTDIQDHGMQWVIDNRKEVNFSFGYQKPGE